MNIHCIAVDDEPLALEKMQDYISRVPYLTLDASFDNAMSAMAHLKEHATDLIFLDIQMEGLSGIQMLETLHIHPRVILTTAYDQFAIKGFELDVTDYLLKPISFERFLKSVDKVCEMMMKQPSRIGTGAEAPPASYHNDFIFVKTEYRLEKVCFRDILFIEGMKDYLRIHLADKRIMTLMSFVKMEALLPSHNFIRVHKSYLISMDKIQTIERNHILMGEHRIPIGESYRKMFFTLLQNKGLKPEE